MIHELGELRDRTRVFHDRTHAGEILAGMLAGLRAGDPQLLAIPAGGVPVAAAVAASLGLPLEVAVVSKITPPWNSEVGYGAVAFDGSVRLNEELVGRMGIGEEEIRRGIEATLQKVRQRVAALCQARDLPDLADRLAILVDDGLASGFTMRTAVEALRRAGAKQVGVAVPTGSRHAVEALAPGVEELYCANVRGGFRFAVADAYQHWDDVEASQAVEILAGLPGRAAPARGRPEDPG